MVILHSSNVRLLLRGLCSLHLLFHLDTLGGPYLWSFYSTQKLEIEMMMMMPQLRLLQVMPQGAKEAAFKSHM